MRTFHLCLSPDTIEAEPGLLETARQAGVSAIWITGFLYGYWHYSLERIARARQAVERLGLAAHIANVPLGHPGDSLGARSGDVPLTPPPHWRLATRWDGAAHAGTSLHPPATDENADALRRLQALGFTRVFLDDDFRLAVSPGAIGGCFCDAHRAAFLQRFGGSQRDWDDLRADARDRELTPRLRAWIDFTCDELSGSFRHMQAAAPDIQLGVMVMYLGAEKAGIRLSDYAGAPLRVGELMFDDASFAPVKGKTDELFSALFHRRFVAPELAYSETTAFPADRLSARNLAAKMNVSLIADARHTMFMSGLTPFPAAHWETLAPAMRQQAALHPRLAGHSPRGPFKHYWGEHARCAGDDIPYSLFLALGVPFEVTDQLAPEGWTFLCDADARGLDARAARPGACVVRPGARPEAAGVMPVQESLEALFAFRRGILPRLRGVPFVEEEWPVVCAWYPAARAVLLWNLAERARRLTVRLGDAARAVDVDGLGVALLTDVG